MSDEDWLALHAAQPALRRVKGGAFERARRPGLKRKFPAEQINRLVDLGLLVWVNRCRSAAVLSEKLR